MARMAEPSAGQCAFNFKHDANKMAKTRLLVILARFVVDGLPFMKRIALGLEYQGEHFHGWQIQPHLPTIQGALQQALSQIAQNNIHTFAAGRTDALVHACHQVVHFDTPVIRPLTAWVRGANAHLPDGISVLWAKEVSPDFHARFCATSRRYRYFLLERTTRPGIFYHHMGWTFYALNTEKMQQALIFLLGTHNFSAFRAATCQAKTPIQTMFDAQIKREKNLIVFDFHASAFLLHMVRNIVGALIEIGKENKPPEWMAFLLEKQNRRLAAPTFQPNGLYFLGPTYDSKWKIPCWENQNFIFQNLNF